MAVPPVTQWAVSAAILLSLSVTAIVLRVLAVRTRKDSLKAHDYLLLFSLLCQIGYVVDVSILGLHWGGYGEHLLTLPLDRMTSSLKSFFVSEWFWATGVASFRIAIALLYMGIFRTRAFRQAAIATGTVVFLYWAACMFTIALLCRPVAYNWDITIDGTCGNVKAIEIFSGAFNMALDLWVVFLPLPVIWRLQIPSNKKWTIVVSFSLGLCTAGVNLGRLIQTLQCNQSDIPFCALASSILVTSEMTCGILVGTVPTLGVLFFKKDQPSHQSPPRKFSKNHSSRSIPLPKKMKMPDDSLFTDTQVNTQSQSQELEATFTFSTAGVGHWYEIHRGHDSSTAPRESDGDVGNNSKIVKKDEYAVSEQWH